MLVEGRIAPGSKLNERELIANLILLLVAGQKSHAVSAAPWGSATAATAMGRTAARVEAPVPKSTATCAARSATVGRSNTTRSAGRRRAQRRREDCRGRPPFNPTG